MANSKLTIGSRGSKLALYQAYWAKAELERRYPDLAIEIKIIKTSGDQFLNEPLSQIGGKGLFTKEIEDALLRREIDLAIHSLKDLPTTLSAGLELGAVSAREDVRDAFLSLKHSSLDDLPCRAKIGTSSLRRQSQLLFRRPDLQVVNLRGNLDTRVRKLDKGQYDAIVVACAGLIRLGMAGRITQRLPVEVVCPAVGQAALGVEIRSSDAATAAHIACLDHKETRYATAAERAMLRRLGGGCHVPIAAYAQTTGGQIKLQGVIASPDGKQLFRACQGAALGDAEALGCRVAEELLSTGAREIIKSLESRL